MKPRTALERKMVALADKLPPITDRQRRYAYDKCFKPRAVCKPRKHEVRCLCCGRVAVWDKPFIESFLDTDSYDCPYCDRTTSIERHYPDTKYRESSYFTILTTFRGYQLARTFEVSRDNYGKDQPTMYDITEVFQNWIVEDGKEIITGLRLHRSAFSCSWSRPADTLEIHRHNASSNGAYQYEDMYDISYNYLYPDVRVTPMLRRNGWTRQLLKYANSISMIDAMRWLLTVPDAEMCVKIGQLDIFHNMVRRRDRRLPFLHALRIAHRRGYVVEDAQMWYDTLSMAVELRLDTHNPSVVCPDDLYDFHDHLQARVRRLHERQERERRLQDATKYEATYVERKAPFLGIAFGDADITIAVLPTVADIAAEGEAMHHCVFQAGYYKRDDALILSARDSAGNRIETIEVNLRTFKVEQSRGKFNQNTDSHDHILDLVNRNMHLIRAAAAGTTKQVS